jgi:hypothetical protein
MSEQMAKLYEKAWNQTVEGLNDWKKGIIINNFPYEHRCDKDVADEVARDAARLAEKWERELNGKVTTPAP